MAGEDTLISWIVACRSRLVVIRRGGSGTCCGVRMACRFQTLKRCQTDLLLRGLRRPLANSPVTRAGQLAIRVVAYSGHLSSVEATVL